MMEPLRWKNDEEEVSPEGGRERAVSKAYRTGSEEKHSG